MQQHRVICKEIHKQLQKICSNKPIMQCSETAFESRAPGMNLDCPIMARYLPKALSKCGRNININLTAGKYST